MQTHRFHNAAALAIAGKGETRYLDAEQAERLARALLAIVESIRREPFTDAPNLTVRFDSMGFAVLGTLRDTRAPKGDSRQ